MGDLETASGDGSGVASWWETVGLDLVTVGGDDDGCCG